MDAVSTLRKFVRVLDRARSMSRLSGGNLVPTYRKILASEMVLYHDHLLALRPEVSDSSLRELGKRYVRDMIAVTESKLGETFHFGEYDFLLGFQHKDDPADYLMVRNINTVKRKIHGEAKVPADFVKMDAICLDKLYKQTGAEIKTEINPLIEYGPLDPNGKSYYSTGHDNKPKRPIDPVTRQEFFPVDDAGNLIFPIMPDGKTITLPTDSYGEYVFPNKKIENSVVNIWPTLSDGTHIIPKDLNMMPIFPIDEFGKLQLPVDQSGNTVALFDGDTRLDAESLMKKYNIQMEDK